MFSKIHQKLGALLLISSLFLGILTYNPLSSFATTQQNSSVMIAVDSNAVDETLGEGTTDKIEGKAQKDLGTVQKKLSDDVEDQVEGTVKQIKGRAKQDIGKTKESLEEAGSDLEEASDNMMDAVKDFFGS